MSFDIKAWFEGIQGGIGFHFGAIDVEFLAPDQTSLLALLHNRLKEAAKDLHSVALTDAGQAGMIGKRLAKVIP